MITARGNVLLSMEDFLLKYYDCQSRARFSSLTRNDIAVQISLKPHC